MEGNDAMRIMYILLFALMVVAMNTHAQSTSTGGEASNSGPKIFFDRMGRVIQVVTSDGRLCTYRYGADGRLTSPVNPLCGEPQDWQKVKKSR